MADPLRVLLAGGGTAGHVNPMLATASALAGEHGATCAALGTSDGLESRLVPASGLDLHPVPRVPLPRRPSADLLRLPTNLRAAVRAAREAIEATGADVVVGFGGYVATPAYLAARRAGVPVVVHEQNARPGLANKVGARTAAAVALTFATTPLAARRGRTEVTGLPLRGAVADLVAQRTGDDRGAAARVAGARALGLDPDRPILLVTGGSLGAQRLNDTLAASAGDLAGVAQVLHLTGRDKDGPVRARVGDAADYHVLDYLPEMEHALACADLVVCRSGAGTVAELSALGLPAVYVPLPHGNGEQRLNAADVVGAGGGVLVEDAALTPAYVREHLVPLLGDADRLRAMGEAAVASGPGDGAGPLAELVVAVARG
ncbi:UDP-N-acetylglucosamine--N-acetylmuramyl-(pentapeptide) pyrophosphoryl-undecaprenol N-acetylglucosamine transferase [Georgenia sp. Z1491]|uniref:UDP-N-acetylglucosamine--N-acetylmuramyl- (pentapeptide) pyrophosphoryl-undecaprenol N-acetylglucosamine transferase n=1 Tax=Georgenia sp. Z1491 TaxID=3416707 RepID=UPI003CECD7E1